MMSHISLTGVERLRNGRALFRVPSTFYLIISKFPYNEGISARESDLEYLAQQYGQARDAVSPQPNGLIICEAEEFQVATPGWQAENWGDNYYAATLANTFLGQYVPQPQGIPGRTRTM